MQMDIKQLRIINTCICCFFLIQQCPVFTAEFCIFIYAVIKLYNYIKPQHLHNSAIEQNKTWHQEGFSSIKSCGHLSVMMINNTQLTIHKLHQYAF